MIAKIYVIPNGGLTVDGKVMKATTLIQHFELNAGGDSYSLNLLAYMKTNLTLSKDYYFSAQSKQAALLHSMFFILGSKVMPISKIYDIIVRELDSVYSEKTVSHVKSMFDIHKNGYIIFRLLAK